MFIITWARFYRHVHVHMPLPLCICLYLFISLATTGIHIWFIRWYRAILHTPISTPCTQEASLEPSPLSPRVFLPCYLCIHMYVTLCSCVYCHTRVATLLCTHESVCRYLSMFLYFYVIMCPCNYVCMHVCTYVSVYVDASTSRYMDTHAYLCQIHTSKYAPCYRELMHHITSVPLLPFLFVCLLCCFHHEHYHSCSHTEKKIQSNNSDSRSLFDDSVSCLARNSVRQRLVDFPKY